MSDTIAAVGTGDKKSAIGIVRMSGDRAADILERVFRPKHGSVSGMKAGRLYYGELLDAFGEVIDLCLATVSRAPKSYTGEDTAELHCHGSPVILSEALSSLFRAGARQAEAGEFTKRAFLNGKLDLTGAEAVADMIDAESPLAAKNAVLQLSGSIFEKAEGIYSSLISISSHFQATIDFPDDGIEDFRLSEYRDTLKTAREELSRLASTYERGRYVREGLPCAIVGRPNVGKSSLFNALLGYERAIVTPIAGTTRDILNETLTIGGLALKMTDTAGLREAEDAAEAAGIERAEAAADEARLVIGVFDGSQPLKPEDERTLLALSRAPAAIAVINKSDLPRAVGDIPGAVPVSAKTGQGIDGLAEKIGLALKPYSGDGGGLLTNARHLSHIVGARDAVSAAIDALDLGLTPDAVLTVLEEAQSALASLMGRNLRDDVIGDIFSRFCVGK